MGNLRGRLGQQQTLPRCGERDPAAAGFGDDVFVVLGRFKAEQRQPEAVLAPALTVAAATVAAMLGEDRNDLTDEVDRWIVANPVDCQRHPDRCLRGGYGRSLSSAEPDNKLTGTVLSGNDQTVFDGGKRRGLDGVGRLAGDVDKLLALLGRECHDELTTIPAAMQAEFSVCRSGRDVEPRRERLGGRRCGVKRSTGADQRRDRKRRAENLSKKHCHDEAFESLS